jgi:hypothetical protein
MTSSSYLFNPKLNKHHLHVDFALECSINTLAYLFKTKEREREREREREKRKESICDSVLHYTSKRYLRHKTLMMMMTNKKRIIYVFT